MPTYITVHDDPPLIRIQINLKIREKFKTYQYEGNLFVKILQKAKKDIKSPPEEAFGVLFVVKDSYQFSLEALEQTHELKIHREEISTVADCAKGILELQLPYTADQTEESEDEF
tara:strand:+ start:2621 stop:2965 length:345 start_codon:yes stop_codon:yes gene_type:complete